MARLTSNPIPDGMLQAYLEALAESGVRSSAAQAVGLKYYQVYNRRQSDTVFAAAEDMALEQAADTLEAEAWRRARDGVPRRKFAGSGENVIEYEETNFSDTLLIFLLKGARPDKFKDRVASEMSGPGGKAIDINDTSAAARIAGILDAARQRKVTAEDIDPFS
jgi:hypothetical protein